MKISRVVIFIWVSLLLSGLALHVLDETGVKLLRSSSDDTIATLETSDTSDTSDPSNPSDTSNTSDTSDTSGLAPRPALEAVAPNTPGTLPHLAAALRRANDEVVRIVHYGDSQIEEDRITSTLRRHLQERYGGQGLGLIPLHQTIPTLSLRQRLYIRGEVQTAQGGPKRHMLYGLKSMRLPEGDLRYGPMAQAAEMDDALVSGSEEMMLTLQPLAGSSRHETIRLLADSGITMEVSRGATDTVWFHGRGRVYGLSLESKSGVIVDNIPMRGCIGTVFTKMDSMQLATFYRDSHTRLIILQYGGNAIPTNKKENTIRGICYALRDQVRYLRTLAPEADILFVGPSDMVEIDESGTAGTNPMVPVMDNTLRALMTRENVPYFSLYAAMGGEGSMLHWQEVGLAGSDGVHFTRAGADKAARMLWKWMEEMIDDVNDDENANEDGDEDEDEKAE